MGRRRYTISSSSSSGYHRRRPFTTDRECSRCRPRQTFTPSETPFIPPNHPYISPTIAPYVQASSVYGDGDATIVIPTDDAHETTPPIVVTQPNSTIQADLIGLTLGGVSMAAGGGGVSMPTGGSSMPSGSVSMPTGGVSISGVSMSGLEQQESYTVPGVTTSLGSHTTATSNVIQATSKVTPTLKPHTPPLSYTPPLLNGPYTIVQAKSGAAEIPMLQASTVVVGQPVHFFHPANTDRVWHEGRIQQHQIHTSDVEERRVYKPRHVEHGTNRHSLGDTGGDRLVPLRYISVEESYEEPSLVLSRAPSGFLFPDFRARSRALKRRNGGCCEI